MLIILFAMNAILSINSSLFNPASGSLLRFIVKDEELQQASAYMQGSSNLQNIIGLILGGIIFATFGIFWIFVINAIGYIISAISEMFIHYDHKAHATDNEEISLKNSHKRHEIWYELFVCTKSHTCNDFNGIMYQFLF